MHMQDMFYKVLKVKKQLAKIWMTDINNRVWNRIGVYCSKCASMTFQFG